jgi:transposase InsO family protein
MCQITGVSRASYYREWEKTAGSEADTNLRDQIQKVALRFRCYGRRRITEELRRQGCTASKTKIRHILREDNLLAVRKRKFITTTKKDNQFRVYPNLVERLELTDMNQLWVADITYIRLQREFVYLAVVLDAFSRKVVGWALGRELKSSLTLLALQNALDSRRPGPGLVHHSDQGSQYACHEYVGLLEQHKAFLSMSRPGRPWENGRCESFIKTLKEEEIHARPYGDLPELERNIGEFIEQFYNSQRLHSALGYRSPEEFEQKVTRERLAQSLPAAMIFNRHKEVAAHAK